MSSPRPLPKLAPLLVDDPKWTPLEKRMCALFDELVELGEALGAGHDVGHRRALSVVLEDVLAIAGKERARIAALKLSGEITPEDHNRQRAELDDAIASVQQQIEGWPR